MLGIWFALIFACEEKEVVVATSPEPQVAPAKLPSRKGFLGVTLELSTIEAAKEQGFERPLIQIRMVGPDSAAAASGIKKNDFIVGVDGKEFQTIQDFVSYIQGKGAGETVVLKRVSGKKVEDITVMLGARPDEASLVRSMLLKSKAPSFEYRKYRGGESVSLDTHKGKVVLLDLE